MQDGTQRIGPLEDVHEIRFTVDAATTSAGFETHTPEHQALSARLRALRSERSGLLYAWHHLRERRVTRLPFLVGLLGANLGVLLWWAVDRVAELYVRSGGTWLPGRPEFKGAWPSIWAASGLFSVYVATWITIRHRRGTVGAPGEHRQWIWGALSFVVFTALAGFVFYEGSGIDPFLRTLGWRARGVELASTIAWSAIISSVAIAPFAVAGLWRNIVSWKPLIATIPITVSVTLMTLLVYFVYVVMARGDITDDVLRGQIVGAGLRSGMFIGLYFASVLSAIKADDEPRALSADTAP